MNIKSRYNYKNAIKLFAVIALILITTIAHTQSLSFHAGADYSYIQLEPSLFLSKMDFSNNHGYHLGVTTDFQIFKGFSFETGLLLTTKGFKSSETIYRTLWKDPAVDDLDINSEVTIMYLEIPLTLKISFKIHSIKLSTMIGMYYSKGVGGTIETNYRTTTSYSPNSRGIKWGSREDFRRDDYGLTLGFRANYKSILLTISYDHGLTNISSIKRHAMTNRAYRLSLGYRLEKL